MCIKTKSLSLSRKRRKRIVKAERKLNEKVKEVQPKLHYRMRDTKAYLASSQVCVWGAAFQGEPLVFGSLHPDLSLRVSSSRPQSSGLFIQSVHLLSLQCISFSLGCIILSCLLM